MASPYLGETGRTAFGLWCSIPDINTVEAVSRLGYDYLCLDLQHGLIGLDSMIPLLVAVGASASVPIVRVPANNLAAIGRALDCGADAVVVPLVSSRAEAEAAVAACRFPPRGVRSYGPVRAGARHGADPRVLDAHAKCLVMIETLAGLEAVEEICATPGLDGVYIGPADLALSLGMSPAEASQSTVHADALATIRTVALRHGIVAGLHCTSGPAARARAAEGFTMLTAGADLGILAAGAARTLADARGTT